MSRNDRKQHVAADVSSSPCCDFYFSPGALLLSEGNVELYVETDKPRVAIASGLTRASRRNLEELGMGC